MYSILIQILLLNFVTIHIYAESSLHLTTSANSRCSDIKDNDKFDCNPDKPIDQDVCLKRGCCWKSSSKNRSTKTNSVPELGVPNCYFGSDYLGYNVTNIENYLYRTVVTLNRNIGSGFSRDSQLIKLEVIELNEYSVRFSNIYIILFNLYLFNIFLELKFMIQWKDDMKCRYLCLISNRRKLLIKVYSK